MCFLFCADKIGLKIAWCTDLRAVFALCQFFEMLVAFNAVFVFLYGQNSSAFVFIQNNDFLTFCSLGVNYSMHCC